MPMLKDITGDGDEGRPVAVTVKNVRPYWYADFVHPTITDDEVADVANRFDMNVRMVDISQWLNDVPQIWTHLTDVSSI